MLFNDRRNSKPQLPTKVNKVTDSLINQGEAARRSPIDLRNSPKKINKYLKTLPAHNPPASSPSRHWAD